MLKKLNNSVERVVRFSFFIHEGTKKDWESQSFSAYYLERCFPELRFFFLLFVFPSMTAEAVGVISFVLRGVAVTVIFLNSSSTCLRIRGFKMKFVIAC